MNTNATKDFKYNKFIRALADPVTSLPTGLNSTHTGYIVTYDGQIWVWDGALWRSWDEASKVRDWDVEIVDAEIERSDETDYILEVPLNNSDKDLAVQLGFLTSGIRGCLGKITHIGDADLTDFSEQKNRRVVVNAYGGEYSYFNIECLNSTEYDNYKPIRTLLQTNGNSDVYNIKKAEFIYSDLYDCWLLLSYEKVEWHKRYTIADTGVVPTVNHSFRIPATGSLPFKGNYEIDVYVAVGEYTNGGGSISADTMISQTLKASYDTSSETALDVSPSFGGPVALEYHFYNHSLQGSDKIELATNKYFNILVSLFNGSYKRVSSGYVNVRYVGKEEN